MRGRKRERGGGGGIPHLSTIRCYPYAPIIVMSHLPQVGPGRGFCRGFVSIFVPRVGDLYHVFWYCVCNFCAYEHHYTKAPTDPLSTIGDFESKSCP